MPGIDRFFTDDGRGEAPRFKGVMGGRSRSYISGDKGLPKATLRRRMGSLKVGCDSFGIVDSLVDESEETVDEFKFRSRKGVVSRLVFFFEDRFKGDVVFL